MSGQVIDRDRRDQAVARVAAVLGDPTGRCPHCHRLVRLATGGLVPDHHQFGAGGGQLCPGGRQQPAAGEPLGHRRDRPHDPDGWIVTRDQPAEPAWDGGKRPPLRDNLTTPGDRGSAGRGVAGFLGVVAFVAVMLWLFGNWSAL